MELSNDLHSKLLSLKDKQGNNIEINEVESLVGELIELFKKHCDNYNDDLFSEIRGIGDKAHEAKIAFSTPIEKKDNVIESAS